MKRLLLVAALALGGCAVFSAETPPQTVYAIESDFNATLEVAAAYERLPRCAEPAVQPCSDTALVAKIRLAVNAAVPAMAAAEATVRDPTRSEDGITFAINAATNAAAALTEILVSIGAAS